MKNILKWLAKLWHDTCPRCKSLNTVAYGGEYSISYECWNCGHTWNTYEIEKQNEIERKTALNKIKEEWERKHENKT